MIELLNRRELELLNRKSLRYPLAVAEKDYFLAVVSKIIYESPLRDKIVFKGGTAIHHCYLPQTRFSEDLDFSSLDKSITLNDVKEVFNNHAFLEVKEDYVSKATIKISRLKYSGPLGLPNSLKVEIDFIQNAAIAVQEKIYNNVWKVDTKVKIMDIKEICAEKLRAASDRARYRDFYDLVLLFEHYKFDLSEIEKIMRMKEVRKTISKESMLVNWQIAKMEKKRELENIFYGRDISDMEIESFLERISIKEIERKEDVSSH